ncbi:hypothetical protein HDV00_008466 [Rhizophlyctis rosea]|nr:hypothetical protein HDV00_008466 [Rhizophlyctis rosea]
MDKLRFKKHKDAQTRHHKEKRKYKAKQKSSHSHHESFEAGWEPPPQSFKAPDDTWSSIWEEDSTASADYWQAAWASTTSDWGGARTSTSHDDWADSIAEAMKEKRSGTDRKARQAAEAERERERRKARERIAKEEAESEARRRKVREEGDRKQLDEVRKEWAKGWAQLKATVPTGSLRKKDLPLPFVGKDIDRGRIERFLLSGVDEAGKKKVLKETLLFYHPDKIAVHRAKFKPSEWDDVVKLVGEVAAEIAAILNNIN